MILFSTLSVIMPLFFWQQLELVSKLKSNLLGTRLGQENTY